MREINYRGGKKDYCDAKDTGCGGAGAHYPETQLKKGNGRGKERNHQYIKGLSSGREAERRSGNKFVNRGYQRKKW